MVDQRSGVEGLFAGLTLSELCALHFSRTLLESLAEIPFRDELESAFDKLSASLTLHMRQFLDQLLRAIASKPDPLRRRSDDEPQQQRIIARVLEATLHHRQATITYHSRLSDGMKYLVHPYRLAYAQGGLYLLAFVPEYEQVRTLRRRAHGRDLALRGTLHAAGRSARGRVPELARRPLGTAGRYCCGIRTGRGR
ncbi:MAG: WYL domain-containing protein [Vicinamibacterales bacterium]